MSDDTSGYPGAPRGGTPTPPVARASAGGTATRGPRRRCCRRSRRHPRHSYVPPPPAPGVYPRWAPVPPDTAELVNRELAMTRTARAAVVLFGLYNLSTLVNLQIRRSAFRALGHHLRVAIHASGNGQPVPSFNTPQTTDPLELIIGLAAAVALVFALIWQFRAASAARALGYPAKRSPGWGVGCWFVPIVSLWMPYQAIRDCLAPDDPQRPLVLPLVARLDRYANPRGGGNDGRSGLEPRRAGDLNCRRYVRTRPHRHGPTGGRHRLGRAPKSAPGPREM